ncbi:MAG: Zn-dependent exopeptidase M28 [Bacteroidaceae bacterium]|nr:Zn-dependent exopeptidase M28 [Bacteroidaceae bacterium]
MKKSVQLLLLVALVATQLQAQDLTHYKRVVKEISSAKYQGRGYAKGGANKAGKFLEKEYKKAGVDEVTLQPFTIDINTFSGKMEMQADGKKLIPGVDFSMREYSPGVHGTFPVYHVDTLNFDAERMFADLQKPEYTNCLVECEFWFTYRHRKEFSKLQKAGECSNAGLIYTWPSPIKFFKAYGERVVDKPIIWVTPEAIEGVKTVKVDVDNQFLKDYEIFNVIAKVEGERHDSCYVFTAHYDHLGNLGKKVFYAGANDNASGTATLVTLAAYYAKHRPPYDMYFLSFSGEDANLRGSEFFANNPIVPLSQIRYLFNIDMIGDNNPVQYCEVSNEGMRGYQLFEQINNERQYFKALNRGELAANSDHYPFATRHVPCIFLENEEGDAFKYYHTIFDNWQHAVFDSYEPVFQLVRDFIERY